MRFPNNYLGSIEAIGFQHDTKLFSDLTLAIKATRAEAINADSFKNGLIAKVLDSHTNIKVIVELIDKDSINASIQPPAIDKNHPLRTGKFRQGRNIHGMLAYQHLRDQFGWVDLANSKVHGYYSKIGFYLSLHKGLFFPENSDEEIASILLHELGHVFCYFSLLGTLVSTNYALATAAEAMVQAPTETEKTTIINDVVSGFNLKVDVKDIITGTDVEAVQVNLADAFIKQQRSALGTNFYDMTAWEFLADQFAVRHGAGLHLARIMDRVSREDIKDKYMHYSNNSAFLAMEALKFAGAFAAHIATFGVSTAFFVLVGIFYHPFSGHYDNQFDRTRRMRYQLTEALKDRSLTKEVRQRYIDDIEAMEAIEDTIKNRRTLYVFLATTLVPSHRRDWKQRDLQQRLEGLSSNSLFVLSAKLNNLAS